MERLETINTEVTSKDSNPRHARFKDALWYNPYKSLEISIIGLGGIGSYLAYFLSRIGDNEFYLYDDDIIGVENMGGQLYTTSDIDERKTTTIERTMRNFSEIGSINIMERFDKDSMVTPYMFTPLDNIETRKIAFENWKDTYGEREDALFVDLRMTVESCEVYFVTKNHFEKYAKTLEGDFPELPCSFKATSHCGGLCASIGVAGFTNFLYNLYSNDNIREVPFKIRVDLPIFNFEIV